MPLEGLNRAQVLGHVGNDPQLRPVPGGQAVLNLRIATTEIYSSGRNERKERTDWHSIVIWGKRAEGLAPLVRKGTRILVEGRMQTRSYEVNGQKRYATEIVADKVLLFTSAKGEEQGEGAPPKGSSAPPPSRNDGGDFDGSDEIPF